MIAPGFVLSEGKGDGLTRKSFERIEVVPKSLDRKVQFQ